MQVTLKDIVPNPFRHLERYPINEKKVAALTASIAKTGFWGNVVGRERGDQIEIAYGHHRLVALQRTLKPSDEVDLIIRDLSDEQMLLMMAQENMEEWGHSASSQHETIRAVVQAYADGLIELPPVDAKTNASDIRFAPSFVMGKKARLLLGDGTQGDARGASPEHPYTAQTLADFLGWTLRNGEPKDSVKNGLWALMLIELRILDESIFSGLGAKQAEAVISEARQTLKMKLQAAMIHADEAKKAASEAEAAAKERKKAEAKGDKKAAEKAKEKEGRARGRSLRSREAARQQAQEAVSESRTVGRRVSTALRDEKVGVRQAGEVAASVTTRSGGPPPNIEKVADKLIKFCYGLFKPSVEKKGENRGKILEALIKSQKHVLPKTRKSLKEELNDLADRARRFADRLAV